jgi:hypothetical protein
MKAKLIKQGNEYFLRSLIKDIPSSINVYHKISETEGEFGFGEHSGKLSIQNCDEIFGVVDVEKLAREETRKFLGHDVPENIMLFIAHSKMFQVGFQKAMELYQPTEIEVEIVMDKIPADLAPGGWDVFPRLDKEGCIILKKVL